MLLNSAIAFLNYLHIEIKQTISSYLTVISFTSVNYSILLQVVFWLTCWKVTIFELELYGKSLKEIMKVLFTICKSAEIANVNFYESCFWKFWIKYCDFLKYSFILLYWFRAVSEDDSYTNSSPSEKSACSYNLKLYCYKWSL